MYRLSSLGYLYRGPNVISLGAEMLLSKHQAIECLDFMATGKRVKTSPPHLARVL